jgi:hypothetical protein
MRKFGGYMQKVEIQVFSFDELEDKAKEKAREVFRSTWEYPWFDENMASAKAFIKHFGGAMLTWSVGDTRHSFIKTDLTKDNFRGVKLKDFSRDHMPTGYMADCSLWEEFYDTFKTTGDAMYAYQQAIESFLCYVSRDVEDYFSDSNIDETLTLNEYDYLADGSVFFNDFKKVA